MSASQNGNEQLGTLGKMVLQKMEELRQLDSRIDKRLEHLNRTDANLRVLFDSLRTSILQTHPLIGQMNDLREGTAAAIESLVCQVKERIASEPQLIGATDGGQARVEEAVAAGVAQIEARAQSIDGDIAASLETMTQYIDSTFSGVRQSAGQAVELMEAKLGEMHAVMAELTERGALLAEKSSLAETQLDEATAAFTAQADLTVAAVRRSVAQQVEQLSAQAKLDTRPILAKLEEQKQAAEAQVATAADSAELSLARRADELKRNAERMIELCEQQLLDRIANIRPRTRAAIESIEQAANQRLTGTMDDMQKAIARAEEQAIERLDALRPRYAEMMLQLERDIREQSKRMEDDAVAGAHWLEHRLGARVEEVAAKVNRALRGEMDRVDHHLDTLPPQRARPASPVQVQIMVDQARLAKGESASAA